MLLKIDLKTFEVSERPAEEKRAPGNAHVETYFRPNPKFNFWHPSETKANVYRAAEDGVQLDLSGGWLDGLMSFFMAIHAVEKYFQKLIGYEPQLEKWLAERLNL